MQLRGAGGESIIPIRIDHYEPEWDCDENCEGPKVGDRNLIAAAPDLLNWIRRIVELEDDHDAAGGEWNTEYLGAIRQARATIAKAEGKDV